MPAFRPIAAWTCRLAVMFAVSPAFAADFGAVTSGNWNAPSTWTGGTAVPGASDTAYIGSGVPTGAAATATVTLTADQSVSTVYLGRGNGVSGTLNLGTSQLTVTTGLYLGFFTGIPNTGTGTVLRGTGGRFTANTVDVVNTGSSLQFGTADVVQTLRVNSGGTATTAATGNVTGVVGVGAGTGVASSLTLGAPLNVNSLTVSTGGTLNAQNHPITATAVSFGQSSTAAATPNPKPLTPRPEAVSTPARRADRRSVGRGLPRSPRRRP